MDKNILSLILEKLEGIEKEQQEIRKEQREICKEQQEIRKEQQEMRKEQQEMHKEQQEMRKEQQEMKKDIFKRLDNLEKGQESIKQFIINAEKAFEISEQDHKFIEKLKRAASE
jgi:septal ring factor EnvC (AmiA/AmiB activator)